MYGQKNYLQAQGIPPTKYRIQQIGCFLTSFANLLERFGKGISPADLNGVFRDRGVYIDVDDGVRDDLGWQSITGGYPQIVVSKTGSGAPSSDNSIVKFLTKTNNFGTHFSLVHDASRGLIVDSWDGQIKSWDVYGGPVSYATYKDITPQPVPTPPAPAPAVDYVVIAAQPGYGISHLLRDAGYSKEQYENGAEYERFGQLNGTKSIKLNTSYKVYKTPLAIAAPAPAPTPAPDDTINITVQSGWGLSHVLKAAGYPQASYENPSEWLRLSKLNGAADGTNIRLQPNQIVKVYRQPLPAPAPAPAPAPPVETPAPTPPAPAVEPQKPKADPDTLVLAKPGWKTTFKAEKKIYLATQNIIVKDLAGLKSDLQLIKNQKVTAGGTFVKPDAEGKDVTYIRTQKSVDNDWWYGIPASALDKGQDPDKYVGPLTDDDEDDDIADLLDLSKDIQAEGKELFKTESGREKLAAFIGGFQGFFIRIFSAIFGKNKK